MPLPPFFCFIFLFLAVLKTSLVAMPIEIGDPDERRATSTEQQELTSRNLTACEPSAELARSSFIGLQEGAKQEPTTRLTASDLVINDNQKKLPTMDNIPSSLSRAAIETTISQASSQKKQDPLRTRGITEVHHLENIQASIRTRPQLIPSFADLNARDQLTFTAIEKEESEKIAKITQNANHAKAVARASSGGMLSTTAATFTIAEQARNAIAEVQKSAAAKKQALFANVKPVLVEANLSPAEQELHSIFDQFAQKLTAVENKRSTNIQAAENKANALQAHGVRRGMGMAVSYGVEENKKNAIDKIEKIATHERNILFLQAKQQLLTHQQTYFETLFETYSNQPRSSSATVTTLENIEKCKQTIAQIFAEEQENFAALGNLEQASESTIADAISTVASADTARLQALQPFVEHSINTALDQVAETTTLLRTLSQSKGNKFLNTQALTAFHDELDQRQANYLLAEALFNGTAKDVALNNASYLRTKIDDLKLEIERTSSEQKQATASDQIFLTQKISSLTNLSNALETALQAYERIADDSSLKIKIPSIQIAGLNILSKLSDFSETENNLAILGRRGEMELIDPSEASFVPNAKLAQEGINLARLAVFRDFGARGLQRFDAHFHDKIAALESPDAQNFLTIGELKKFIAAEDPINPSAFYLSSAHSIAELIFAESDPTEDNKIVKSDGTSFNVFSKTAPTETTFREDQETAEGITATRTALKEFFKDLPPELRQGILNRFDAKFKTAEQKTPLTVEALRSFIKTEIESLKTYDLDLTGPFFYSLAWHIGTTSLWTFMMSAHPPVWLMMGIGLGMGIGHDMTSYWRQIRPEEER